MSVSTWLKTALADIWNWLGAEEAKAAALLSPIIDEIVTAVKGDAVLDLSTAATTVAEALASGTTGGALITLAYNTVKALAVSQGVTLSEEALTALAASLSAGAQQTATTNAGVAG